MFSRGTWSELRPKAREAERLHRHAPRGELDSYRPVVMMMMMMGETDTGNSRRRIFVLAWSNIGCGMKKLSRLKTRYLERVRTNRQDNSQQSYLSKRS